MTGNLKKAYTYAEKRGLRPRIDIWFDGFGEDEGFQVVIKTEEPPSAT